MVHSYCHVFFQYFFRRSGCLISLYQHHLTKSRYFLDLFFTSTKKLRTMIVRSLNDKIKIVIVLSQWHLLGFHLLFL